MWNNTSDPSEGSSKGKRDKNDSAYVFEQQNDVRMNELGSKLSALKNITIDMHQDITDQDRTLDETHNSFSGLGSNLQNSFGRMNRMISKRHQRQLCFYVFVAICVFLIIYYGSGFLSWGPSTTPSADTTTTEQDI